VNSKLKEIDYGKSRVRVARVKRLADRHEFTDLTVAVRLQGTFEDCYLSGDNSLVIPTDTMKNTIYAIGATNGLDPIERFACALARHFLDTHAHVSSASIDIVEHCWNRIDPYAFEQSQSQRLASVQVTRDGASIHAGIDNLVLLKTTKSGFTGFLKDKYTTLPETNDRIFATSVKAVWRYASRDASGDVDFDAVMQSSRATLIRVFAEHDSLAVQQTLYAIADAVLNAHPEIAEIRLTLPNRHYIPVNLVPLGLENRNEIFLPTDEPHGLIEACLSR
jgi:urate oxidase